MSFFNDNQNFIRIKLQSDLKGKSLGERKEIYNRLQHETRNRIIRSQQKALLLSDRIKNYKELFEVLGEFEFDYLLMSIFFDSDCEKIILEIGSHIIKFKPNEYDDKYSLVLMINFMLLNFNRGGMRLYLVTFFRELFKKPTLEMDSKEERRNDLVTRFCQWLEENVKNTQNETEIQSTLIHFSKVWQILYNNPFDQIKGVVLLHGIISVIKKMPKDEVEKLFKNMAVCKDILSNTLVPVVVPPLWDEEVIRLSGHRILEGFKNKLIEFNQLYLVQKSVIEPEVVDIFSVDFTSYYRSNKLVQEKLSNVIFTNIASGKLPTRGALELLEQLSSKSKAEGGIDSKKLRLEVYRRTYSLENLKLKSRW